MLRLRSLRPARFDELGLRRALPTRIVPLVVAAMAFLASLAAAGWMGAAFLTRQWEMAARASLTVEVPRGTEPDVAGAGTRIAAVQAALNAALGVESAKILSGEELDALLRPWLGTGTKDLALPVPSVVAARLSEQPLDLPALAARLAEAAPGTTVEHHEAWAGGLGTLTRSLQLCAGLIVLIVTLVTVAVISIVVRSGLATRRESILIVSQLGATDGYIARRFAARAGVSAAAGAAIGGVLALPVTLGLATLAAPLSGLGGPPDALPNPLLLTPQTLLLLPLVLPVVAAAIGYVTAQLTVRQWLRRMVNVPAAWQSQAESIARGMDTAL